MEKKYISDEITKDMIGELGRGVYLIGAEVGSGKTTFVENVLIDQALHEGKKILILAHRKSLVRQIAKSVGYNVDYDKNKSFFYNKSKDENGEYVDDMDDVVSENVCISTYQKVENAIKSMRNPKNWSRPIFGGWNPYDFDYVACDEPHYIVTDASYNFNTIYSLQFIKTCGIQDKKVFLLTGTPKPLTYIDFGRDVTVNVLRTPNNINHNVDSITISKQSYMDIILVEKARLGEKAIVFVSSASNGVELRNRLLSDGINAGFVCADGNYKSKDIDSDLKDEIIEERKFDVQIAVLTSVMNTGISIENSDVKNVFMIGVFSPIEIQQSVARLRLGENQDKIKLYISNSSMQQRRAKMEDYILTIDKNSLTSTGFAEKYGQYNQVRGMVNTYEGDVIHPCYLSFCKMAVDDYVNLKLKGIFTTLKELFPNTKIVSHIKKQFKGSIDEFLASRVDDEDIFLKEYIKGVLVSCEELHDLMVEIDGNTKSYNDLAKKDYKIGMNKLNKILEAVNSKYKICSKRVVIGSDRIRIWVVRDR